MQSNVLFILCLLVIVIAAPVVDATVCEDCNDFSPLPSGTQQLSGQPDQSAVQLVSAPSSAPQAGTAQDFCQLCSQSSAAMNVTVCCLPAVLGPLNHLPELLSFSNLSSPIIKPPQN